MKNVGKILLLIAGIGLMVAGIWTIVTAVTGLFHAIGSIPEDGFKGIGQVLKEFLIVLFSVIGMILYLCAGITGVKTYTDGDENHIKSAFAWGIVILVLNIFMLIYSRSFLANNIVTLVVNAAYVTGAFMVRSSTKE